MHRDGTALLCCKEVNLHFVCVLTGVTAAWMPSCAGAEVQRHDSCKPLPGEHSLSIFFSAEELFQQKCQASAYPDVLLWL